MPGRSGRRADRYLGAHRELQRERRVHALRVERRVPRVVGGRGHFRGPGLRAIGPARRRDTQPEAEHPARDHRRHGGGDRPLHRAAGRVHPGARPLEPVGGLGRGDVLGEGPAVRAVRRRWRRPSAWAGSQSCSTRMQSSRPGAPAFSTPGRAPGSPSRSLETASSRRSLPGSRDAERPSSPSRSRSSAAW